MDKSKGPAKRSTAKVIKQTRVRRHPTEIIGELKAIRATLAARMEERFQIMDARIANLQVRYEKQIKLAELASSMSIEEITQQLDTIKQEHKLLRMAIRQKT